MLVCRQESTVTDIRVEVSNKIDIEDDVTAITKLMVKEEPVNKACACELNKEDK